MAGKAKSVTGYTTIDGIQAPHGHAYEFDEFGNGQTVGLVGQGPPHTHSIVNKKVKPSGFDGHTHRLATGKPGTAESLN